jgi:hypothetical protein
MNHKDEFRASKSFLTWTALGLIMWASLIIGVWAILS